MPLDENGLINARVTEAGSMSTVMTEQTVRDDAWHHMVVTFGDSPKAFKLYLDGVLQNQPVVHSSGMVSIHLEEPSLGSPVGTSAFPGMATTRGFWMN